MPPHFPPSRVPFEGPYPSLPIVTPDPPRRSAVEKYGGMYLLGLAGLVVVVGLVSWFAIGVWSLRAVWSDIYTLHDESRPTPERVRAAYALSRDGRVTPPQRWEMCLRKPLPELARYVLAESLTAEIVRADPRHYSLMVARSPGWPDWLRLLLVRPLAYGAAEGLASPRDPLVELGRHHDPAIRLWADFARSASPDVATDPAAGKELEHTATHDGPDRELAVLLREALRAEGTERARRLDRATLWLRDHHPDSARLWETWEVRGDRLAPKPASELLPEGSEAGAIRDAVPSSPKSEHGKERRR